MIFQNKRAIFQEASYLLTQEDSRIQMGVFCCYYCSIYVNEFHWKKNPIQKQDEGEFQLIVRKNNSSCISEKASLHIILTD